jgi:hypothetical protein
MYDTIYNDQFPQGAQAYAAYVDGGIGDQPNYGHIVSAFPKAHHLGISLSGAVNADALDVENGAAETGDIPGWCARQRARGIVRPCVYANASTMTSAVLPELASAGIARASVRLWTAHYSGSHICGPSSCGAVPEAMDGTQWCSNALGRVLDESLLLADFFTVPPSGWTFPAPGGLHIVKQTGDGYTFAWDAAHGPSGQKPASYSVYTYNAAGALVNHQVVKGLDASEYGPGGKGLPAGEYQTRVWGNGAPSGPPHAALNVTLTR